MTKEEIAVALEAKQAELKGLMAKGDEMTVEDVTAAESLRSEVKALKADHSRFSVIDDIRADTGEVDRYIKGNGRVPLQGKATEGTGTKSRVDAVESEDDKYIDKGEFKGLAHFLSHVRDAGRNAARTDDTPLGRWNQRFSKVDRAIKSDMKAPLGMNTLSEPDSTFIPITFNESLWQRVVDETPLMQFFAQRQVSGNTYVWKLALDHSRSSSIRNGGVQAYWIAEGGDYTATKPKTRNLTQRVNKLGVLIYLTEEEIEDAIGAESYANTSAVSAITASLSEAFMTGDGNSQPLGLLNAGAKITITAESGQGASTVVAKNILNMYARRNPGAERTAIWLYNQDVEAQLDSMYLPTGSTVGSLVYLQPPGLSGGRYSTIRGRPAIPCEYCPALGTEGDIMFVDPTQYQVVTKAAGIRSAVSMHVQFLTDQLAYKWTIRVDGRPLWDQALTPQKGATRSPIITLSGSRT